MREIKFRVLDKDGEMRFPPPVNEWDFNDCQYFSEYTNKTTPVMQYTGLKDTNGVEYYEDDLISNNLGTDKETIRQVMFIDGCWMLSRVKGKGRSIPKNIFLSQMAGLNWPIVGNIHENPELLKEAA